MEKSRTIMGIWSFSMSSGNLYSIRRGLRALEAHEFPMPSNIVVPAGTRRELASTMAEIVLPRKKIYFSQKIIWFETCF